MQRDFHGILAGTSRRSLLLIVALIAVAAMALFYSHAIQESVTAATLLRRDTLDEGNFHDLLESSSDPVPLLERAWNVGGVPHRRAVINALLDFRPPSADADAGSKIERLLRAGALDPDLSVREVALGLLLRERSVHLPGLVRAQLRDVDPEIRLLGLNYLRRETRDEAIHLVAPMLTDPETRIVAFAAGTLRLWTGEDFGARLTQTVSGPSTGPDLAAFQAGIEKWKNWWREHQNDYPAPGIVSLSGTAEQGAPAADFELPALEGNSVRASQFRGKAVLLNFWATWCTACVGEFETLNQLQAKHGADLVVLGISLDGVPDEHDNPEKGRSTVKAAAVRQQVERVARSAGLNYKILLDPANRVGARFNGGELPTNVLIDRDGRVRRRFVGLRNLNVFEDMLAEVINRPGPSSH